MTANGNIDQGVAAKYEEERQKRIRKDGEQQFINLDQSDEYSYLAADPWVNHAALNSKEPAIKDGGSYEYLILGAGYGGLIFAAKLIESGVLAKDIRLVDTAGGFGGTWYWNRYPGLMCDVESYIYMPLLEQTEYMPKHRYAYGTELREHANRIAAHFDVSKNALFRSRIIKQTWNETEKVWKVDMQEYRGPEEGYRDLQVTARFTFLTGGVFKTPHIPKIPGLDAISIPHFHTARWRYDITGGSQENPSLDKLKGLRVGVLGTGATAVQVVPALADFAKHLYVFQRTPASCEVRGQRETDPTEYAKISAEKGWQRHRAENFNSWTRGEPLEVDLVQDGWCSMPSFGAQIGSSRKGILGPQDIPSHLAELQELDFPRSERLRSRVDKIVKDKDTAAGLKAWYPTYCKRPTFHDEYLQAFNKTNVQLVQTLPHGIDAATEKGLVVDGVEYPVDIMVFSTGFGLSPTTGTGSPADGSGIVITGRDGLDLSAKWSEKGPATLHGVATHSFPNLFFASLSQSGTSCNVSYFLDTASEHVAYILNTARKQAGTEKFSVEPTEQIEEQWANEVVRRAAWFVTSHTCTPGYTNGYGADRPDPKDMLKLARKAPWGMGSQDYYSNILAWRKSGKAHKDLDILV